MRPRRRLVVDADLAETDPTRQTLEEAVALGKLLERGRRARRQQAEVAGIFRNLLPRAPVDQRIETLHRKSPQPGLVLAVGLGGVDHVIAVIEPIADQRLHQRRRMLTVAVHEQHGAKAGVIETGKQRRLLAEIARQRDDLDVEPSAGRAARDCQRVIAAAVVDIDDLGDEPAGCLRAPRDLADPLVQRRQAACLVVDGNDDGQASVRPPARPRQGTRSARTHALAAIFDRLSAPLRLPLSIAHADQLSRPLAALLMPSLNEAHAEYRWHPIDMVRLGAGQTC